MVEAFTKRWGNHSSVKACSIDRTGFPTFTVNHFAGPVTHSSESFLERNLEALNPDFVSLLRGTSAGEGPPADGSGSSNPFVRSLDLATTTKREIRTKLEQRFWMDLSARKRVVNEAIDRVLLSRAG